MAAVTRSGVEPLERNEQLAVEAAGLVKSFGGTRAVDGLDLTVPAGTVYGVLGPNGAGKTTTIRILATLIRPDAGIARVLGHDVVADPAAVRDRISLTGQFAAVDDDLTGTENLELLGRLLGLSRTHARQRAAELLDAFGLAEAAGRPVKTYSGGMRRRVDLAAGIIVTPDLLFLDEPTTGLDPQSRNQIWDLVRGAVASGTTVLLSTQYLDEADQLADRIAVIDHGRVIAEGTPGALKASIGAGAVELRVVHPDERAHAAGVVARTLRLPVSLSADPAALSARVAELDRVAAVFEALRGEGIELAGFSVGQPSLDEVFLALTGHHADDTPNHEEAA